MKITLESFKNTHDAGVDFRYCKGNDDIIVQCKRYRDSVDLFKNLKQEVVKAAALNPRAYILTTSAALSIKQKIRSTSYSTGSLNQKVISTATQI